MLAFDKAVVSEVNVDVVVIDTVEAVGGNREIDSVATGDDMVAVVAVEAEDVAMGDAVLVVVKILNNLKGE